VLPPPSPETAFGTQSRLAHLRQSFRLRQRIAAPRTVAPLGEHVRPEEAHKHDFPEFVQAVEAAGDGAGAGELHHHPGLGEQQQSGRGAFIQNDVPGPVDGLMDNRLEVRGHAILVLAGLGRSLLPFGQPQERLEAALPLWPFRLPILDLTRDEFALRPDRGPRQFRQVQANPRLGTFPPAVDLAIPRHLDQHQPEQHRGNLHPLVSNKKLLIAFRTHQCTLVMFRIQGRNAELFGGYSDGRRDEAAGRVDLEEDGFADVNEAAQFLPCYQANGWRIGSGHVEAACKAVVGQRLKGGGMRWGEPGADAV
jgi:hypothetical protein